MEVAIILQSLYVCVIRRYSMQFKGVCFEVCSKVCLGPCRWRLSRFHFAGVDPTACPKDHRPAVSEHLHLALGRLWSHETHPCNWSRPEPGLLGLFACTSTAVARMPCIAVKRITLSQVDFVRSSWSFGHEFLWWYMPRFPNGVVPHRASHSFAF